MLITYHGHSEFYLEAANGFALLTDPFDERVGYPMGEYRADAVTVSHGHYDHNYTASRSAMLDFWKVVRRYRQHFIDRFNQPVYEQWLAEAVALGRGILSPRAKLEVRFEHQVRE